MTWVVDDEEHVTQLKLPPNVVHVPEGRSLAAMMAAGEIDAAFTGNAGIGREGPPQAGWEAEAAAELGGATPSCCRTRAISKPSGTAAPGSTRSMA